MPIATLTQDHRYFMPDAEKGFEIPGTTTVIGSVGCSNYDGVDIFYRDFGTKMHELTRHYDEGWLSEDDILGLDDMYRIPLDGYRTFRKAYSQWSPLVVEVPLYHPTFLYGGTPDRVLAHDFLKDTAWLIDLKFGRMDHSHFLQLAAYKELVLTYLRESKSPILKVDASLVYIAADGGVKVIPEPSGEARKNFAVFLSALTVHQWKMSKGKGEKP